MDHVVNIWMWLGFSLFVVIALGTDTFLLNSKLALPNHSIKAALWWTLTWVFSAFVFNFILWLYYYTHFDTQIAQEKAIEFLTGYLIEKTLSIDNIFAFYLIFTQFKIPVKYQHRVFSYGIWSAIFLRLGLILVGSWLVSQFHWTLYLMGAFLFLTGTKMCFSEDSEKPLEETFTFNFIKRHFRITHELQGHRFFIRKEKLLYATPLFIALVFIEISDVIFAFDSIPAIFAITQDPFIVWSSNIFAILGLRALYFLIAHMIERFSLLKYGMALILVFVGSKMMIAPWLSISSFVSLGIIAGILLLFTGLSVLKRP